MTRRFTVLLVILVSGPLALAAGWPFVAARLRTADLKLSLVTQPRAEVVASGYLHNHEAPPFSLETLTIEEPGKESYRRQVSLDAEHRFELALGEPKAGSYRVSAFTRKATWLSGVQERWVQAPPLVLEQSRLANPSQVRAQDIHYEGVVLLAIIVLAAQAALVVLWFRSRQGRKPAAAATPR